MVNTLALKNSTNLQSATFDDEAGVLDVVFTGGKGYRYRSFTADLVAELLAAPSAGKWFSERVRKHPELFPVEELPAAATKEVRSGEGAPAVPAAAKPSEPAASEIMIALTGSASTTVSDALVARELAARAAPVQPAEIASAPEPKRVFAPWRAKSGAPPWHARRPTRRSA